MFHKMRQAATAELVQLKGVHAGELAILQAKLNQKELELSDRAGMIDELLRKVSVLNTQLSEGGRLTEAEHTIHE